MHFRRGIVVLAGALALSACSGGRGARDARDRPLTKTHAQNDGAAEQADAGAVATTTVRSVATPAPAGVKPSIVARANAFAIATTKTQVYFGDAEDDTLFAVPKKNATGASAVTRIARRAPVSGALVADETSLTWIASPGDAVLRMPLDGSSAPTTIRDREIFTDVAASGGEVFLTGAAAGGGALTRITGPTAARLASFDVVPRSVFVDATSVFIVTTKSVLRTPRKRGEVTTLATGAGFGAATSDDACIYVSVVRGSSRAILRVPKYGGATNVTSSTDGVRDAPIAVRGGEVFFFDEARSALRAHAIDAKTTRLVSDDPIFERVSALAVDEDGAWVATGEASSGAVVHVPFR